MKRRNKRGQYAKSLSRFTGLIGLIFTVSVGLPLYYQDHSLVQHFVSPAVASESQVDSTVVTHQEAIVVGEIVSSSTELVETMQTAGEATPQPAPTIAPRIIPISEHDALIEQIFGEKADEAKQIMRCESGGRADNVGDTHLFVTRANGDRVGDSIGLFQIRTGGKEFNRARANGMTPDEFRAEMKNPEKNIKYAKSMYDKQGWKPWFNCMKKLGL